MSIPAGRTALVLLAAGLSARYPGDKLLADLHGRPLIDHAASILAELPFLARIAVVPPGAPERSARLSALGFELAVNPAPGKGQSGSIAAGVQHAAALLPDAVLIALADMPFVPSVHYRRLLERLDPNDPRALSFTGGGDWRGPPAAFANGWLADLMTLSGDKGARSIIAGAPSGAGVPAPEIVLADMDTPADFDIANKSQTLP